MLEQDFCGRLVASFYEHIHFECERVSLRQKRLLQTSLKGHTISIDSPVILV